MDGAEYPGNIAVFIRDTIQNRACGIALRRIGIAGIGSFAGLSVVCSLFFLDDVFLVVFFSQATMVKHITRANSHANKRFIFIQMNLLIQKKIWCNCKGTLYSYTIT